MNEEEKTIVSYDASDAAEENKNSSDTFRKVAIGGGIGILLGASAAAVAQTLSNSSDTPDENAEVEPVDTVNVASGVSDGMSFGEAFAAARAELGPGGMFTWHGNSYSTYTADEWDGMSAAERAEYGRLVAPHVQFDHPQHVVHHTTVHHVQDVVDHPAGDVNVIVEPAQAEVPAKPAEPAEPEEAITGKADDLRLDLAHVRVTEAEEVETFNDVDSVVGKGFVDGHDAMFHDLDSNGVFDAATVDANDNHTFIDDQKYDISDLHLSTQNVEAEI